MCITVTSIYINNACGIRKPMLLRALNLEAFINLDFFLSFFVIEVWHPRFPLTGIKKYLT